MNQPLDLVGIGIGPFNLSLAALLEKAKRVRSVFLESKPCFDWHPEVMFSDSSMQTSFLKDLVTPVDPTSPYSFLNYIQNRNLFYQFLNTQRSVVSRREFEQYCAWVSTQMPHRLKFNSTVQNVEFKNDTFEVETADGIYRSHNICIATGQSPRIPTCAAKWIGPKVFHAKSPLLKSLNLNGQSVAVIGGGQTGIEIFRNAIHGKWGSARSVRLLTRRKNLEALDESAFTNDFFTPSYVDTFWNLDLEKKLQVVASQKLASDGNTPGYLSDLYNDLYRLKHIEGDTRDIRILACRSLIGLEESAGSYKLELFNSFLESREEMTADVVILCTGFETAIPKMLTPLLPKIRLDGAQKFKFKKSYSIEWDGPQTNRIYALNFSRHNHGIIDPQTSMMAWRSAVVVNDLTGEKIYSTDPSVQNFVEYETVAPVSVSPELVLATREAK